MAKRNVVSWSIVLLVALTAAAAIAEEASREEVLARELLEVTGGGRLGLQIMEQMVQSFMAANAEVPREFWDRWLAEVDPTEFEELIVPVYTKHLTAAEMEASIAFYRTPAGRSILRKMPLVMEESVRAGQQWGMELALRVQEKLAEQEASPSPP